MKFYQLFQRFGLTAMVSLASLLIILAIVTYNSTTYVVLPDDSKVEISHLKDSLNQMRAERKAEKIKTENERKADWASRGIKVTELSAEQKAANKRYDEVTEAKDIAKENYEIEAADKEGPVGFLLANMYFFFLLAVSIALVIPISRLIIDVVKYKSYTSLLKVGVPIALIGIIYLIAKSSSGHMDELLDMASVGAQQQVGGLLVTTIVLIVIALLGIVSGEIYRLVKK